MGPHLRSLSCLATTASLRGDAIGSLALRHAVGSAPWRYHAGPDAWMCRYRQVPRRSRLPSHAGPDAWMCRWQRSAATPLRALMLGCAAIAKCRGAVGHPAMRALMLGRAVGNAPRRRH